MWRKLGRVFDPAGRAAWMQTHAALPLAFHLSGDVFRVYCAGRDDLGRAQIGAADIEVAEHPRLLKVHSQPILSFGELGTFDDRGVLSSALVRGPGSWLLYYTGVMLGRTVPFYYAVGLACSFDRGETWRKHSRAPILERSEVDPLLTASPYVLRDGSAYRMWYTSGVRWEARDDAIKHYYHLKYADSADGISWMREGRVAIDFQGDDYAISRPCVIRDPDSYRMWYAHRGSKYRIGYAESPDGLAWKRSDGGSGIIVSDEGWDCEMLCYPFVFDHSGRRYMLYNGNGYGKSGFGLAVLT